MIHGLVKNFRQHSAIFYFCNDEFDHPLSPEEFSKALFESYKNRDLSAFLMGICQNTIFDLLRNSFLIPYRFNADGKQNPIIMTDEKGLYYRNMLILFIKKNTLLSRKFIMLLNQIETFFWLEPIATVMITVQTI